MKNIHIVKFGLLAFALTATSTLSAQDIVLQHISEDAKTYTPVRWNEISRITVMDDESRPTMTIEMGEGDNISIDLGKTGVRNGYTVPLITITTEEEMEQIPDKINYKVASLKLSGFGNYDDAEAEVSIRGRGNTSWEISDKKPYRLKFSKKISLCGLNKAKSYVLLPNWTDGSLMQNAIAAKIGHMVDMPYVCDMIPVDVILNGIYRGSYLLANKPGINAGNVDIDEETSIMWELDTSMDEELTFRSPIYNLPVMVKDPDMDEARFLEWKEDFIQMERAVNEGKGEEWIDLEQYAAYRAVYTIMGNHEVGLPHSVKIYKTEGGKYKFGPLWDFDVAMGTNFGYELDGYHLEKAIGGLWMNQLMEAIERFTPGMDAYLSEAFKKFFDHEDDLWEFIDETAAKMETSALRNSHKWSDRGVWHEQVEKMKTWLTTNINALKANQEADQIK